LKIIINPETGNIMTSAKALSPEKLCKRCDPKLIPFDTSAEISVPTDIVGQKRALKSIYFGTRIEASGYNLFAFGSAGTGKNSVVRQVLEEEAKSKDTPPDWCYVYNFYQPHKPNAISLPPGKGVTFRDDIAQLADDLNTTLPAAFETDEYQAQLDKLDQEYAERRDKTLNKLIDKAKAQQVQLIHTPTGFAFAPLDKNNEVVRPKAYEELPEKEKNEIEKKIEKLQKELQQVIRQFPIWQKEVLEKVRKLEREIARYTVKHLIGSIKKRYTDLDEVLTYLDAIEEDVIEHVKEFRSNQEMPALFGGQASSRSNVLERYKVNLIVDHSEHHSAPIVYQDLPSHSNLIGCTEYQSYMGTLVTDYTLIKAGDLHQANGGYLILDARRLLIHPYAWEALKRALRSGEVRIESLERSLGLLSTVSLEPEPIPLNIKVVLVGDRLLYYMLQYYDPEFRDLFKVAADFEDTCNRDDDSCADLARFIGNMINEQGLKPIDREGVSRVIEYSARLAGDSEKLSIQLQDISDLLSEANYWANEDKVDIISDKQVQVAIDHKVYRSDRVREHIYEAIDRGFLKIDTDGERVGQINGLSVLDLGDFSFGQPSRITATSRLGNGELIDIERETEMGGNIHSKGVLILSRFLASRYAIDFPLSLSASLVFEQSYGMVDGDSASLAELCALLSTLANTSIHQSFAVTGSVNQLGEVQAIGGINQKIEGFFDVCKLRGLTGKQGVLMPATNVKHLMLRQDVVDAAANNQFHIYPINNVDEAIGLLTGVNAGARGKNGKFRAGSINARVEQHMIELAQLRQRFSKGKSTTKDSKVTDKNA
jgi:predicted ATP-dependent protease